MQAFNWIASHPELVGWALLSVIGALWPESRIGSLARRWASDLRGPKTATPANQDEPK